MIILNGQKLAEKILKRVKEKIKKSGKKLKLAVVLVGDDKVSKIFIKQKEMACKKVGIDFKLYQFPQKISQKKLKKEVKKIIKEKKNSGVIVQLPLPKHINSQEILNLIPPQKDADFLSQNSLLNFYFNKTNLMPPVVKSVYYLLKEYKIKIREKNVLLIGAGRLVGLPLIFWFLKEKIPFSIVNEFTKDISFFSKRAEIIISGVGKPKLIKEKMIKKGVIIIDIGTSFKNGKLMGDVDFEKVAKKTLAITPVPGGIGPLVVASLIENLVKNKF